MTEVFNWGDMMKDADEALQPVPKGVYSVVVDKCEYKPASTGKPMWVIIFRVTEGPHTNRTIYFNLVLTKDKPMALRMFFLNVKALGIDQSFFATNPAPQTIADALVGKRARVDVDWRLYQGQNRENVKTISPAGGMFADGTGVPSPGGPGVPGASPIPTPGLATVPTPTAPQPSPVLPQPAPQPVAPVPTAPTTEASFPIPAPVAPAPPEDTTPIVPDEPVEQANPATFTEPESESAAPQLPPGMTAEQFAAFQAWQAQQVASTPEPAPTSQTTTTPSPKGLSRPPLPF